MPPKPPKPDRPGNPKVQRAALERLLRHDPSKPRPRVEVRLTGPSPTPRQLAALGLDDLSIALVSAVAERHSELLTRVAGDRGFAERLATDPASALEEVGVPRATLAAAKMKPGSAASDHIRDILFRFSHHDKVDPVAATDLLAATVAGARGNPAKQAELRTNPQPQVVEASIAHPPAGVQPGSPAMASLVIDVTSALLRAAGAGPASGDESLTYHDGEVLADSVIDIPIPGQGR